MLNITHYQRNANQNQIEYHLTPFRMAIIKKSTKKKKKNAGEGAEKREPSFTVGGNANWDSHWRQCGDFLKNWG